MNRLDPEAFGAKLDWKDFEEFAESAFLAFGFETRRNVRFRKPRAEIDLVASKNGLVFAADCKHWKRTVGHASMLAISERQKARAKRLVQDEKNLNVIPVVITLHDESLRILENGVPIIPIHKISDFLLNWEESVRAIAILSNKSKKSQQMKLI